MKWDVNLALPEAIVLDFMFLTNKYCFFYFDFRVDGFGSRVTKMAY